MKLNEKQKNIVLDFVNNNIKYANEDEIDELLADINRNYIEPEDIASIFSDWLFFNGYDEKIDGYERALHSCKLYIDLTRIYDLSDKLRLIQYCRISSDSNDTWISDTVLEIDEE